MPMSKGRFLTAARVPVSLALFAAYLTAAPGTVNPAAPLEAAASTTPSVVWASPPHCTGYDRTLSVRAGGGRWFFCSIDYGTAGASGFENPSDSCGASTPFPSGYIVYKFESGSCLGPATFSWESQGTPYVQNLNIEANGNEPPDCNPLDPGTTVPGEGIHAWVTISCIDEDFDGSGQDDVVASATDPAHGSVHVFRGASVTYFEYTSDFPPALLGAHCEDSSPITIPDDSFAITIGDDYGPNPKSLPPIDIFVDNSAQRAPRNCPPPGGDGTGGDGTGQQAATGQRALELKQCKSKAKRKHWSKKRLRKCKEKAKLLPV